MTDADNNLLSPAVFGFIGLRLRNGRIGLLPQRNDDLIHRHKSLTASRFNTPLRERCRTNTIYTLVQLKPVSIMIEFTRGCSTYREVRSFPNRSHKASVRGQQQQQPAQIRQINGDKRLSVSSSTHSSVFPSSSRTFVPLTTHSGSELLENHPNSPDPPPSSGFPSVTVTISMFLQPANHR